VKRNISLIILTCGTWNFNSRLRDCICFAIYIDVRNNYVYCLDNNRLLPVGNEINTIYAAQLERVLINGNKINAVFLLRFINSYAVKHMTLPILKSSQ
jgi:hypothetical protein